MATLSSSKVEKGGERKQVVLVPDSLYTGMFAGYSMPKSYKAFEQGKPDVWKMFAWFTLTHDRANQRLSHFSSALLSISCVVPEGQTTGVPKLFYDAESGFISGYTAFLYAMRGGKLTQQEIVDAAEDYDLDEFIGFPAIIFTKQGKANKEGLITQKVQQLQPADKSASAAALDLFRSKRVEYTEDTNLAFLGYPTPMYQEDVKLEAPTVGESTMLEDEIPF